MSMKALTNNWLNGIPSMSLSLSNIMCYHGAVLNISKHVKLSANLFKDEPDGRAYISKLLS